MAAPDDESFEALLKPLENITSKVWDIALTKALENYLAQLNNGNNHVNFTEAAVLVQNSASFYCKRVDSVYLGCQQFVEKLMDTDRDIKDPDAQGNRKKKVVNKAVVNDDFEPMGPFVSDTNLFVNLDTIDKNAEKKKVILNKYPKTQRKAGTSCPVFQTKGKEMGLKEEFRLNWKISSSGVLHEDFMNTRKTTVSWESLSEAILEIARNSFLQLDNQFQMDVDEPGPLADSPGPSFSPFRDPSPLPPNSPLPQPSSNQLSAKGTLSANPSVKTDIYQQLNLKLTIPPKEFFKKKQFTLPSDLIEQVKNWKATKAESKEKAKKSDEYTYLSFFEFLWHRILLPKTTKPALLALSAKQRRKEILQRKKMYGQLIAAADEDCNGDFPGFEPDDSHHDIAEINLPLNEEIMPVVEVGDFTQERNNIMEAAKDLKRKGAAEQTEIARRVQAWHESLQDVLDNAESRAQYDIHQYGSKILEKFKQPPEMSPVLPFKDIVRGQPKHEISRYFLASLMLVNTYNVELITSPGELVKDCLNLKLLSLVRHHEEMDENLRSNTYC